MGYVGRFAPSPTGPLHLGSLLAAAASYLHARQANGEWLVRIDDIDPPREVPDAAATILKSLDCLGLHWDRSVRYQSTRTDAYRRSAAQLLAAGLAYRCSCTRTELSQLAPASQAVAPYPGLCRNKRDHVRDTAIRVRADGPAIEFDDGLQGPQRCAIDRTTGDYVIYRRDGLPAYHLAAVLDDADQGISHVVRGADLLDSTPVHIHLQRTLGLPTPAYSHVPVIVNPAGQKLSKQTGATPIELRDASELAGAVAGYLGLVLPQELQGAPPTEVWAWAIPRWRIDGLRGRAQVPERP